VKEAITKDNRRVVLKFTDKEDGLKETEILTRLRCDSHPGIIELIETLTVDDQTVLVFPFIDDKKKHIPQNVPLIRVCIAQLLSALQYIHSKGVIHADIKPDNILFDGSKVVLIDFGHSVLTKDVNDVEVGTGSYSPPELHLAMADDYSVKIDVWSVAVILHEWLTGKRLFHDMQHMDRIETFLDVLKKNGEVQFDQDVNLRGRSLSDVCSLLGEMFEQRPTRRPTAKQCLKHHWFTEPMDDPSKLFLETDSGCSQIECKRRSSITDMSIGSNRSECSSRAISETESMPTTPMDSMDALDLSWDCVQGDVLSDTSKSGPFGRTGSKF